MVVERVITCNMNAVESGSDFIAKPTEAQGYLVAAQGMLAGATPLGNLATVPVLALTLLCGHSCEAALKAILCKGGISAVDLSKRPFGHNILTLWKRADSVASLPPQPDWVAQLASVYDRPFHLRYPLDFHFIVLPNNQQLLIGTSTLVQLAERCVNA